ncbi:MAG: ParB/RepB/Spo0J family partition protein [bacterium]
MSRKKESILRKCAHDTFASLPVETEEVIEKRRGGIRDGTKRLSGARMIDIYRIKPDPIQPRKRRDDKNLNELAASIKEHGVLQPITVEYVEERDYFKIINGERRFKAAKLARLSELPCIIKNVDRRIRLIHQLIENIQRQDLPPLEEAEAIQTLIENRRVENPGYSQRDAAKDLSLPKTYVNEMLSLLKLPEDIKMSVRTSDATPKSLLLMLVGQSDEKSVRAFYKEIKEGKLTVREAKTRLKKSRTKRGRPQYYQYTFRAPEKDFTLRIRFRKRQVDQSEIINALSRVLHSLKGERV